MYIYFQFQFVYRVEVDAGMQALILCNTHIIKQALRYTCFFKLV